MVYASRRVELHVHERNSRQGRFGHFKCPTVCSGKFRYLVYDAVCSGANIIHRAPAFLGAHPLIDRRRPCHHKPCRSSGPSRGSTASRSTWRGPPPASAARRRRSTSARRRRPSGARGASPPTPSSATTTTTTCRSRATSAGPAAGTGPWAAPSATSPSAAAAAGPSAPRQQTPRTRAPTAAAPR